MKEMLTAGQSVFYLTFQKFIRDTWMFLEIYCLNIGVVLGNVFVRNMVLY